MRSHACDACVRRMMQLDLMLLPACDASCDRLRACLLPTGRLLLLLLRQTFEASNLQCQLSLILLRGKFLQNRWRPLVVTSDDVLGCLLIPTTRRFSSDR